MGLMVLGVLLVLVILILAANIRHLFSDSSASRLLLKYAVISG